MIAAGERHRPAWLDLQPGDPWTFITSETIPAPASTQPAQVGDIIDWYPEGDDPMLFHVDEVTFTFSKRGLTVYGCTYVGRPAFAGVTT